MTSPFREMGDEPFEAYGPPDRVPEPGRPASEEDEEGVCGSCGGDMGFLDYCPICGEEA